MYYYISGRLVLLEKDFAVIDAGGVGYKISVSLSTCSRLSAQVGSDVVLYTYLNVREDIMELFGFPNEDELALFKSLIGVSGVGPKGAMSILGTLSVTELLTAISRGDAKSISRAPGIGFKTGQKVCIELHGKSFGASSADEVAAPAAQSEASVVIDTLLVYGFKREQIEKALSRLDASLPAEELIRRTLQILGTT